MRTCDQCGNRLRPGKRFEVLAFEDGKLVSVGDLCNDCRATALFPLIRKTEAMLTPHGPNWAPPSASAN